MMRKEIALLFLCYSTTVVTIVDAFSIPTSSYSNPLQQKLLQSPSSSSSLHATTDNKIIDSISSNEDLIPGINAINELNYGLLNKLKPLRERPYFRLYSVDILASCEYMPQELFECYSETCEVYPVDEEEIPPEIQQADAEEYDFKIDGWARWDMPSEDYYDTLMFPESYTGYDGSEVWEFIHNRLCFTGYEYDDDHWKADFNKAVSGLHSMISAQIILGIQDKINTGEEFSEEEIHRNPSEEFQRRLSAGGETSLALENLYFGYMLILKAVTKARTRLLQDCESGKIDPEAATLLRDILSTDELFLEASVDETNNPVDCKIGIAYKKLHDHAIKDSDSIGALWEARMRCRELLRIMNCVQCNKCRFHGKIAFMGLSTAFKILVGDSGEGIVKKEIDNIHRVELAALMTCLYKFSSSIQYVKEELEKTTK